MSRHSICSARARDCKYHPGYPGVPVWQADGPQVWLCEDCREILRNLRKGRLRQAWDEFTRRRRIKRGVW